MPVTRFQKIATLLMLVVYLSATAGMRELLKLPMLAEHYFDHKEERRETNLLSFLMKHYTQEDGTDADADEDSRLPFKAPVHPAGFAFVSLTAPACITLQSPVSTITDKHPLPLNTDLYSNYFAAIWQPPRSC